MTPRQIKSQLAKRELTQTEIAKRLRVSLNAVSLVINGKTTSRRIERFIAKNIGVTLEEFRGEGKAA